MQTGGSYTPNNSKPVVTKVNGAGQTFIARSVLNSSNTYSMLLTKYNTSGTTAWTATFGVNTGGDVYVGAMTFDASGNILITGSAYNGTTNNNDLFVVKYNTSGTQQWYRLHNGPANTYDFGAAVACDASGDVYVTGGAFQTVLNPNVVTIRYNSSGTAQWTQTWDNVSLFDAGGNIVFSSTTMVTIMGFTQVNATTWEYVALNYLRTTGQLQSYNVTNLGGTSIDRISSVTFDNSGNTYITGTLGASGQGLNIKTVKFGTTLNILWTANWNGAANLDDVANAIAVDAAGTVYVAGYTTTASGRDAILLSYNSGGSSTTALNYDSGGDDAYQSLGLTSDGGLFAAGYASPKGNKDCFAAFYLNGSLRWQETYNGYANGHDEIKALNSDGADGFYADGPSAQQGGTTTNQTIRYARHSLLVPLNEGVNAPFVENRGQLLDTDNRPADGVRYYTRSNYPNVYIMDDRASFAFAHIDTIASTQDTMTRLDLTFASHSSGGGATIAVGLEQQEAFHNYYLGHIPEGRERVPLENKVLHPNIYTNIDALYGLGQDGFFMRFVCKPGSTPSQISMRFTGHTAISIQSDGSLRVETALEDLILAKPTALYSDASGTESTPSWVPVFVLNTDGSVGLSLGTVPGGSDLIVKTGRGRYGYGAECDFYWSTYYGKASSETTQGNDVNSNNGDMYFCGKTRSQFFPTTTGVVQELFAGSVDAFVSCFKQLDAEKWGTFYGGDNLEIFPLLDVAYAVKWKKEGNLLYFVGRTTAQNFPLVEEGLAGEYDNDQFFSNDATEWTSRGYVGKLDAEFGLAKWVTLFGDSGRKIDGVCALHITSGGTIAVGGFATDDGDNIPSEFPFTSGGGQHSQQEGSAYIAEFGDNNNLLWATKLASESFVNWTHPTAINDISEDGNGNLLLVGTANHDDLAVPGDFIPFGGGPLTVVIGYKTFVMRFSTGRALLWSRFFGGYCEDLPNSIVGLANGDFYITGTTCGGAEFPVQAVGDPSNININDLSYNGGFSDIFAAKFLNNGTLNWCRYYGGPGWDAQGVIWDTEHELLQGWTGTGNCAFADETGMLYMTGFIENEFQPIVGQANCPYFHDKINEGGDTDGNFNTNGTDAWVAVVSPALVTQFSSYWGGSNLGENSDEGNTIVKGKIPFNNREFLLFGGWTNSINIPNQSKPIPLCHETDDPYYVPNLINGGPSDAFISKIYIGECLVVGTEEGHSELLSIAPNPTDKTLSISYPQPVLGIQVFTATGQNLSNKTTLLSSDELSMVMDVSQLPSGWYLLSVTLKDGSRATAKFIKL